MSGSAPSIFRGLVPVLATFLLLGCVRTAPRAAPGAPPLPAPPPAAAAALERCGRLEDRAEQACYQEALAGVLAAEGVRAAMRTLDAVVERDADVKRDSHVYAHAIGIGAYAGAAAVGRTFAECTPEHQSGCHHGVIQAYFVDVRKGGGAIDSAAVNALCSEYRGERGSRWLDFQCAHGMGHGLVMFHGHDLPAALRGCDLLDSLFERETCYQGAFMENVVNALMPHHPAAALAHGGGHDHHAMGGGDAAPAFRALDPGDPLYPCSVMEQRYLSACYSMQTSAVMHFTGRNVRATAAACGRAPEAFRSTCYVSLGRDVSGMTLQDRAEAIRRCSEVEDAGARAWCHVGAATNMLNVTARVEDGMAYCREVAGEENKSRCHRAVGEQLLVLAETDAAREEGCRTAEAGYVERCRAGARLATEPVSSPRPSP